VTPFDREKALDRAIEIAASASEIVMRVYAEPFEVELKGIGDPVTVADRESNEHITRALAASFPGIPIVAEESDPSTFAGFEAAERAWFVDPLDGTREFVAKNGEFAVMIGLAEHGRATLGAIVWPARGRVFGGAEGLGSFEILQGTKKPLAVSTETSAARARVVVSRSHSSPKTAALLERLGISRITQVGSAGVKGVLVACGETDVYLHRTYAGKRWDSCAPEAIVRGAGGVLTDAQGMPIDYRTADLTNANGILAANATLHAAIRGALTA
jgi:3'(2'), 5'-bisphosphate nucleotidase